MPDLSHSNDFGPLIFGDTIGDTKTGWRAGIAALILIPIGIVIFVVAAKNGPVPCIGMFLIGVGAIFICLWIHSMVAGPTHTHFYENGVIKVSKAGELAIKYDDIGTISYSSSVGNGMAQLSLYLGRRPGEKSLISWNGLVPHPPAKPDAISLATVVCVRDIISTRIAARVLRELDDRKNVSLTVGVTLEPTGIRLAKGDFISFAEIDPSLYEGDVVVGDIELYANERKVLSISTSEDNYWPARILFENRAELFKAR
jgi:hypothetical protein